MGRYVLRRLLQMIPVILGVTILVFTILYFIPGDPVRLLLGAEPTPAQVEAKREAMGLNDPYLVRLGRYVEGIVLHFDFGKSWIYNTPVTSELLQRFPRTLTIAVICMLMQILIGTPLGIIAAVNRNGWGDRLSMFIAMFGISMPNFWIALMLVLLFLGEAGLASTLRHRWTKILYPSLYSQCLSRYRHPGPADALEHAGSHPFRLHHHRSSKGHV